VSRAKRWADTLHELAELHDNRTLELIANRVDEDYVQRGREMPLSLEGPLLIEAAEALR